MSNINNISGLGDPVAIGLADPGIGTELTIEVAAGEIWKVEALQLNFAADATIANRNVRLLYQQGSNFLFIYPNMQVSAGQTVRYDFVEGIQTYVVASGNKPFGNQNHLLPKFFLDGDKNGKIFTVTSNLQAGDNISNNKLFYKRWKK